MMKMMIPVVALVLSGCTNIGQWRDLQIDGSSESAFDDSLAALHAELPESRRAILELALVDIVRTESQNAAQSGDGGGDAYTYDDFRMQLDRMTYDGVIALADQQGRSIATIYYSGARNVDPWDGRPWPQTDQFRFLINSQPVMPPGPTSPP